MEPEVIEPDFVTVSQTAVTMDTSEPITSPALRDDTAADLLAKLCASVESNKNKYEVATLFSQCEARVEELNDTDKHTFNQLQVNNRYSAAVSCDCRRWHRTKNKVTLMCALIL